VIETVGRELHISVYLDSVLARARRLFAPLPVPRCAAAFPQSGTTPWIARVRASCVPTVLARIACAHGGEIDVSTRLYKISHCVWCVAAGPGSSGVGRRSNSSLVEDGNEMILDRVGSRSKQRGALCTHDSAGEAPPQTKHKGEVGGSQKTQLS